MRCLWCGKTKDEGTILDYFREKDGLCYRCRHQWKRRKKKEKVEGYSVEVCWEYNEAFREALLQYKECYDEALYPIFFSPVQKEIKRKYGHKTIVLLPSSKEKVEQRGFDHLAKMCSILDLPMIYPFEKRTSHEQKHLSKQKREEMIYGIQRKSGCLIPRDILLVDDVMTTGSTLRGALSQLDASKHRISILVAAYVEPHIS